MKIKTITYKRKFNLKNFENEDIELTAVTEPDEDITKTFLEMKKKVNELHEQRIDGGANSN